MATQITDIAVESVKSVVASDLAEIAMSEGGYESYHIVPLGADGYRKTTVAEMIFHAAAGRAGIAYGSDADWTDATSPQDAAERFFGINGKEMVA